MKKEINEPPKGFVLSDGNTWYSIQQMAELTGFTETNIRIWRRKGKVERIKEGGQKWYRLAKGIIIIRDDR